MDWLQLTWATVLGTSKDVLPIAAIIFGFQLFVIRRPIPNIHKVLVGFVYVLIGLALFLVGLETALFPLGKLMAEQLTDPEFIAGITHHAAVGLHWTDYYWVYILLQRSGFPLP